MTRDALWDWASLLFLCVAPIAAGALLGFIVGAALDWWEDRRAARPVPPDRLWL